MKLTTVGVPHALPTFVQRRITRRDEQPGQQRIVGKGDRLDLLPGRDEDFLGGVFGIERIAQNGIGLPIDGPDMSQIELIEGVAIALRGAAEQFRVVEAKGLLRGRR